MNKGDLKFVIIEKARPHKYIKRLGTSGQYQYIYSNLIGRAPRTNFQKKYGQLVDFEGRQIWQFPGRYDTPEMGRAIEIPKSIRIGKGVEPELENLSILYRVSLAAGSSGVAGYTNVQDFVDLSGIDKVTVHENLVWLVKNGKGVLNVNRWGQAVYFKFVKPMKIGLEVKLKESIEELRTTGEAYALGKTLTKEQAMEVWKEYKRRLETPHPEDLQEWNIKGFTDQMYRETVEGFFGTGDNIALRSEEIDKKFEEMAKSFVILGQGRG
jgi:hypothetical protein